MREKGLRLLLDDGPLRQVSPLLLLRQRPQAVLKPVGQLVDHLNIVAGDEGVPGLGMRQQILRELLGVGQLPAELRSLPLGKFFRHPPDDVGLIEDQRLVGGRVGGVHGVVDRQDEEGGQLHLAVLAAEAVQQFTARRVLGQVGLRRGA